MNDVKIFYSKYRKTWNVIVNGEWYYESSDYESANDVAFNCWSSDEDYEYNDYYEDYEDYN